VNPVEKKDGKTWGQDGRACDVFAGAASAAKVVSGWFIAGAGSAANPAQPDVTDIGGRN
tara:strand:- start:24 stop:200 length:177 start_codon:yes stop_codon:yes gene_type:complete